MRHSFCLFCLKILFNPLWFGVLFPLEIRKAFGIQVFNPQIFMHYNKITMIYSEREGFTCTRVKTQNSYIYIHHFNELIVVSSLCFMKLT